MADRVGPSCTSFRVQDGKVVEHWAVRDDLAMLEQDQPTKRLTP